MVTAASKPTEILRWFARDVISPWRFFMINARLVVAALTTLVLMVFVSGTAPTQETELARGAKMLAPLKRT